jgi:hypothetical protein
MDIPPDKKLKKILLVFYIFLFFFNFSILDAQVINDSTFELQQNLMNNSFALLPTIYFPPKEGSYQLSTGYGLTFSYMRQIINNLNISTNFELILSKFKEISLTDGRIFYEKTAFWINIDSGPKYYLNYGVVRFFLNVNIKFNYLIHGKDNVYFLLQNNTENAFGLNFGYGAEIPINQNINLEMNPGYNIFFQNSTNNSFNKKNYFYNLSIGLRYYY